MTIAAAPLTLRDVSARARFGCKGAGAEAFLTSLGLSLPASPNGWTFDGAGRLVVCNRRYIEMYGLSPDVIKPGCTVRQVVEHRIETGSLTATESHHYVSDRQAAVSGGTAQFQTSSLPVGTDNLSAVFTPTSGSGYSGSTGTLSFTVNPGRITGLIGSSSNPISGMTMSGTSLS